jgi:hypothetical protein
LQELDARNGVRSIFDKRITSNIKHQTNAQLSTLNFKP